MRQFKFLFFLVILMIVNEPLLFSEKCFGSNKGNLSNKEYTDPKGFFKILPPDSWRIQEYPNDPRGKVAFIASDKGVEFRILAKIVEVTNFNELFENTEMQAEEIKRRFGAITKAEKISLGEYPAVKVSIERNINGHEEKTISISFLRVNILHNFTYSGTIDEYSKYLPVVELSMETYEPRSRNTTENTTKHAVAAKIRRVELDIEMGDLVHALQMANEGLDLDPMNQKLIELKKEIIELKKKK